MNDRLIVPFEVKAEDDDSGVFEGFGSVFGNRDAGDDIVVEGAFKKSLAKRGAAGIAMLWQHDSREPIGNWLSVDETVRGLKVVGQLLVDGVQRAREAHVLLKAKALNGLSIGYATKRFELDTDTGVRRLLEVDLMEISVVTFPMNDRARVGRVKALSPEDIATKRQLEDALRDAGFSKSAAAYVAANWTEPALRDAGGEDPELVAACERAVRILTS